MYNPSEHIPLSKPLGAGRFPIDGKFMFYTNGVGGVFAYRPFVNLTEVYNYFPLGSDFRKGNFEILVNTGGTLSGDGGSITGGSNDVYWWKDGLADINLVLKNSSGSGLITEPYTESDLVYDGTLLQYYLPVTLTSTQLVVAVSSTESGTKDQVQFSVINGKIYGFASNSTQNIIVKIG